MEKADLYSNGKNKNCFAEFETAMSEYATDLFNFINPGPDVSYGEVAINIVICQMLIRDLCAADDTLKQLVGQYQEATEEVSFDIVPYEKLFVNGELLVN